MTEQANSSSEAAAASCRLGSRFESPGWRVMPTGAIRGNVFMGMEHLSPETAVALATDALRRDEFPDMVRRWNGLFAIVVWLNGTVGIAVDRARSIPVFYAVTKPRLVLSDNAGWIRRQIGRPPLDPVSKAELLLAGIVLNRETLCRGIHQVQSGEVVVARPSNSGDWICESTRYRLFQPDGSGSGSYEDYLAEYDRVLTRCFERSLRVTGGRPVLVPLSGGYDSRLLLLMLVRLGVKDVAAYSYGRRQSEVMRSREVADALGVPWKLCDYSTQTWKRAANGTQFWDYVQQASNLASVACIQEWLAIRQQIVTGIAGESTVIMPGYAADVPAGSFFSWSRATGITTRRKFEESIWSARMCGWKLDLLPNETRTEIARKVQQTIERFASTIRDWTLASDYWMFAEKVPKFTVNAVRAADSNGCDWWLPFFDDEFLAFWERVPCEFRLGERLHCEFTDRLYTKMTGKPPPVRYKGDKYGVLKSQSALSRASKTARKLAKAFYWSRALRKFRELRQGKLIRTEYQQDSMGWLGIVSEMDYARLRQSGAADVNSLVAAKYLELVSKS